MDRPLQWGVLATGNIARQFADGLAGARRSRILAAGSRTEAQARDFADRYGIERAYGSYERLLADPEVEAIYLAAPNHLHCQWTLKALDAGKHVLCEKPLAPTRAEAERMFERARQRDRLLMEGLMYLCHPLAQAVRRCLEDGEIGPLRLIRSSFCLSVAEPASNNRFDPAQQGGALMDVGLYCLSLARWLAGEEPAESTVSGHLHELGVDDYAAGTLRFPAGAIASFTCALTAEGDNRAVVSGRDGYLELPVPWKPPQQEAQYILGHMTPPRQNWDPQRPGGREVRTVSADRPLYALEADRFAEAVRDGAPLPVSVEHSLGNAKLLEQLRQRLGLC